MWSPLKGFLLIVSLKATVDKWRIRFCFRGVQFNIYLRGTFLIEYLGEIQTEFEHTLGCLSGAQVQVRIMKKIEVEDLVTHFL